MRLRKRGAPVPTPSGLSTTSGFRIQDGPARRVRLVLRVHGVGVSDRLFLAIPTSDRCVSLTSRDMSWLDE